LHNRSNLVLSTFGGWAALTITGPWVKAGDPWGIFAQILIVGGTFAFINNFLSVLAASVRTESPFSKVWALSVRNVAVGLLGQIPMGWLMAQIAIGVGLWATIPFMIPLVLARITFTKYAETRDLFFGTVSALSQAIDAKDGFTRGHADRVSRIAGAIAREMDLGESEIERIELAGDVIRAWDRDLRGAACQGRRQSVAVDVTHGDSRRAGGTCNHGRHEADWPCPCDQQ